MSTAEQREERWMETYRVQSAALERLTARVRELEAAARAVLPLLYDDVTDGMIRADVCRACMTFEPDQHSDDCPIGRLAALVGEEEA